MKRAIFTKMFVLLLVSVLCSLLTGCTSNESTTQGNKKITLVMHFKSGKLDPHNDFAPLRSGITETLIKLDENGDLQGWLASKWEIKDEQTWVFIIRDDVTFQDGSKLDAAAVKSSFERAIQDSQSMAKALKIKSMEANGQTFTIRTTEPNPALISELVSPYTSIISVNAEKKMGKEAFNNSPVGTGPFKVKKFTPNTEILLERYDEYWGGKPKLDEAVVRFNEDPNVRSLVLQSGEADIVYSLPPESLNVIKQNPNLEIVSQSGLRAHFILFNQQKPTMQDLKIRKAIDYLVNRNSIVRDISLGNAVAANGPFNRVLPFGNKDLEAKFDIEKAESLLMEAGYQLGPDGKMSKDGKPLVLQLITYKSRAELPLISQLLQSDAAKIGVTIQIKMVENPDTYLKDNKDWDIATYSNSTSPRGDGGYFLNTALLPGGALNLGEVDHASLNEIIKQLNRTSDIAERIELSKKAVTVINKDVLHSYAIYPNLIVGMNKRVISYKPGREEYYILTHTMDVK
ncbi:nickel ABC transporter substrate-binding protein [Risungbinella massiliensis]|uniref:nickel ABC transporter substrate-binding protein n=1 Tax=Risungbinella massiliensis TaxID=1329796 RepID=UPI0005CBACEC|nr:nickel ABC transporter substrate-binding protein [Risungbinella massiliensis]